MADGSAIIKNQCKAIGARWKRLFQFVSQTPNRPEINGVWLERTGNNAMRAVATDGTRMVIVDDMRPWDLGLRFADDGEYGGIVSAHALPILATGAADVVIDDGGHVLVNGQHYSIDETYPQYRKVIPATDTMTRAAVVDVAGWGDAIKSVAVEKWTPEHKAAAAYGGRKLSPLGWNRKEPMMIVLGDDGDQGFVGTCKFIAIVAQDAPELAPAAAEACTSPVAEVIFLGQAREGRAGIGLDWRFVTEAANGANTAEVSWSDAFSPATMTTANPLGFTESHIIMPMRI